MVGRTMKKRLGLLVACTVLSTWLFLSWTRSTSVKILIRKDEPKGASSLQLEHLKRGQETTGSTVSFWESPRKGTGATFYSTTNTLPETQAHASKNNSNRSNSTKAEQSDLGRWEEARATTEHTSKDVTTRRESFGEWLQRKLEESENETKFHETVSKIPVDENGKIIHHNRTAENINRTNFGSNLVFQQFPHGPHYGNKPFFNRTLQHLKPVENPKKVLLMAYMRGGSSFLGQMFVKNPNAFYWFEIVDPMYGAMMGLRIYNNAYEVLYHLNGTKRTILAEEVNIIHRLLNYYLNCQLDKLPNEMLLSQTIHYSGPKWNNYQNCMANELSGPMAAQYKVCLGQLPYNCSSIAGVSIENLCHWYKYQAEKEAGYPSVWEHMDTPTVLHSSNLYMKYAFTNYVNCIHSRTIQRAIRRCLPFAEENCKASSIVTTKMLRMNLWNLGPVLKVHPDWKVVHQIRDPRGILISQRATGIMSRYSQGSIIAESNILCDKMFNDTSSLRLINPSHPDQLLLVRYEDYADAPTDMVKKIYHHIGSEINKQLISAIDELTHNSYDNPDAMDQHRQNSSRTARAWTRKMTTLEKKMIDKRCRNLYLENGYSEYVKLVRGTTNNE